MHNGIKARITAPVFILLLLLITATGALAGPRDHEDGFFLRLSTGFGGTSTSISDGIDELEISGSGADMNIAIGAMVSPNVALHGTLYGWTASDPDFKLNGLGGEIPSDLTAAGAGIGMTYYFMPANFYLSGSIGAGSMEFEILGESAETETGLLLDLTLGKEWWVGDKWGLGVAGGLIYHSFGDPDIDESWSGTSFTIRFTASMN